MTFKEPQEYTTRIDDQVVPNQVASKGEKESRQTQQLGSKTKSKAKTSAKQPVYKDKLRRRSKYH